jgi:hypothetical protein
MDQSGMGGPTSSYATASIAPWLIRSLKEKQEVLHILMQSASAVFCCEVAVICVRG